MSEISQSENTQPNAAFAAAELVPALDASVVGTEELIAARKEVVANYDRYTRVVADLENFRKRTLREKEELRQYATSDLMEDVIPILDNLSLSLAAAKQQTE